MSAAEATFLANRPTVQKAVSDWGGRLPRKGRTSSAREYWTLAHFLSSLAGSSELPFPIAVTKGERPDFIVQSGNMEFGLEITEATTGDYQKWLTKIDDSEATEMFQKAPYHGNAVERRAAQLIVSAAVAKDANYSKKPAAVNTPDVCCYLNYDLPILREKEAFEIADAQIRELRRDGKLRSIGRLHAVDSGWAMFDIGGQMARISYASDRLEGAR